MPRLDLEDLFGTIEAHLSLDRVSARMPLFTAELLVREELLNLSLRLALVGR